MDMPHEFYPFVMKTEAEDFIQIEQNCQGVPQAYIYGSSTRAEDLMSAEDIDLMWDIAEGEATYGEPEWSIKNQKLAELRNRVERQLRRTPFQMAAE